MIRIITDSTSDIPMEKQAELGIDIVPLSVLFGDKRYTDGVDLKKEQFFEMLAECKTLPTTSQVNPDGFYDLFKGYVDKGDQVIGIFISSKLSGTCQSALIAKDMVGSDDIHIIDSRSTTFGLALLVYEAMKRRDSGANAKTIYDEVMALRSRVRFYAVVNTLKYLKMGGRLSSSAAIIGSVLNIKPLVSIVDGKVKSVGKARGQKAALAHIADFMKKHVPDKRYTITFGHTCSPPLMKSFIDYFAPLDITPDHIVTVGCVVGTHSGPGCIGLAYIEQ